MSHVGNDSANVTIDKYLELACRFLTVRSIAAHLGIGVLGPSDTAVNAWGRSPQPNVWFDMGTLRAFCSGAVEGLLDAVGPDRICFGTDAPLYHPAPFVRMLEAWNVIGSGERFATSWLSYQRSLRGSALNNERQ